MNEKSTRASKIELVWPGKAAVVRPAPLVFDVIERNATPRSAVAQDRVACEEEACDEAARAENAAAEPTHEDTARQSASKSAWTNLLVHGDNARVLATLLARSTDGDFARRIADAGGVKLVYMDPPFGVGADFALDNAAWLGAPGVAYRDHWDESGVDGAASHLQWLFTRLTLAREILRDDGVLYLHVDQRVSAHAKLILDEVFGRTAFRGWIVWKVGSGAKSRTRWSNEHNDILCYAKGDTMTFHTDVPAMREPFAATSRAMHFKHVDEAGRRVRVRVVNGKEYRYYEDEGRVVGSVWTDRPSMAANSPILTESTGWPTQKPEALLARILESSTDVGDLVLELCSGSGTTPAVAEKLGRRWIAIDASAQSVHTTRKRIVRVQRERVRGHLLRENIPFEVLRERTESSAKANDNARWVRDVRTAYGASEAPVGAPWSALRRDVPVSILPYATIASVRDIGARIDEAKRSGCAQLEVLACAFESDVATLAVAAARERGVELALKRVPAHLDLRDPFLAEASIASSRQSTGSSVNGTTPTGGVRIAIEGFEYAVLSTDLELAESTLAPGRSCIAYAGDRVLRLTRDRRSRLASHVVAESWSDAIDAWGIATVVDGTLPIVEWVAMRTRGAEPFVLSCTTSVHAGELRVRVVDVFAHDHECATAIAVAAARKCARRD